jgi:hypothetical protein
MKRIKREYLRLLEKSIAAIESAIDSFNRVNHPYKNENTLILLTNAWELLSKAILVRKHHSIVKDAHGNTISAEVAVNRLKQNGIIDDNQDDTIQQIISLRHSAIHHVLPTVPVEVMHHLLFFGCKFFRDTLSKTFPSRVKSLQGDYLSLSFSDLTTYADRIQKLVSRIRRSNHDKRLVWFLERGIRFDGSTYMTETEFEQQYMRRKKIMPHLGISDFIRNTEMVRIVPVQAPRNFTADITLRKGSIRDSSLPIIVTKTDIESDYPYLTKELGRELGKNQNFAAAAVRALSLKGNPKYHQAVRSSRSGQIHRYSQSALDKIKTHLNQNVDFNPYKMLRQTAT